MTEPAQTVINVAGRKEEFIVPTTQRTKNLDVFFKKARVHDSIERTEPNCE
jgi:hypothetical protein